MLKPLFCVVALGLLVGCATTSHRSPPLMVDRRPFTPAEKTRAEMIVEACVGVVTGKMSAEYHANPNRDTTEAAVKQEFQTRLNMCVREVASVDKILKHRFHGKAYASTPPPAPHAAEPRETTPAAPAPPPPDNGPHDNGIEPAHPV